MALQQVQRRYEKALGELKSRLVSELRDQIEMIIVYGSVAREDATAESDIDVMIISSYSKQIEDAISAIRTENDLKYETATTLILYTPEEFEHRMEMGVPLIGNVLKEGRALHGKERFRGYQKALSVGG